MAETEGYKDDVLSVPDPGLDGGRIKEFGFNSNPPASEGFHGNFQGATAPSSLPGEPGHNPVNVTLDENDYPRQTGHDTLPDDVVPLT